MSLWAVKRASSPKSMKLFIDLEAEKSHCGSDSLLKVGLDLDSLGDAEKLHPHTKGGEQRKQGELRRYLDKTLHVIFSQSVSVRRGGGVGL